MSRRLALAGVVLGTCGIALAYLSAFVDGGMRWGAWCMVIGLATIVVSLMILGVARRTGGVGPLACPLAFTFVVIVAGFGAALVLPDEGAGATIVLGLPLRAALVVYGVGVLPLLVLPLAYALTFDAMTLREEDLARVRALGEAYRAGDDTDQADQAGGTS